MLFLFNENLSVPLTILILISIVVRWSEDVNSLGLRLVELPDDDKVFI